jgi:hypothetical protein
MVIGRQWILFVLGGLPLACGGNDYATAAGATAVAVAATGVHRALTGDCWGRCSPGYACNHESGLCVPGECDPICPAGSSCTVTPTGNDCRPDAVPLYNPASQQVGIVGGATPALLPSDAERPGRAAPGLTPDRAVSGQVQIQRGNPGPEGPSAVTHGSPDVPTISVAPPADSAATSPCPMPPAPPSGQATASEPPPSTTSSPKSNR